MKYLFIAEKPSLMRDVQACYNHHKSEINRAVGQIGFVALAGHVCANYEPNDYKEWNDSWDKIDYPMIPDVWKVKIAEKKLVEKVREMVKNYDGIIVGTDSDQEGYGIYHLLEQVLKLQNKKTLRFIEHSLTDAEILKSLLTMTDYHKDPAHQRYVKAFLLRSRADWLYGMNCTRMMTIKMQELMKIGRVKAPVIKLVYDNSMAIENFKSEKYIQMEALYGTGFRSVLIDDRGKVQKLKAPIPGIPKNGFVESKVAKVEEVHAPRLYDLTSIQSEAGQKFGYTPAKVLEIIQSLYETHKIISYPRTQCRCVSSEKAKEFPDMLEKVKLFDDLKPFVDAITQKDFDRVNEDRVVVNDVEVSKESHDALLPTDKQPDLSVLNDDELKILRMIYVRLLSQFLPKHEVEKTKLTIRHGEYLFAANGNVSVVDGWRKLYGKTKDVELPKVEEGDQLVAEKIEGKEKKTTPPKRLTQATLISLMKNIANFVEDKALRKSLADSQGIGTVATRASIIKDIIDTGYVIDKKGLYITDKGKLYINGLKGIDIVDPTFAAILDMNIKKVQRGEAEFEEEYEEVLKDLKTMCRKIDSMEARDATSITCLACGKGKLKTDKYYYKCPECGWKVSKVLCGTRITEEMLRSESALAKPKSFTSKAGKKFRAGLCVNKEKGVEFVFENYKKK